MRQSHGFMMGILLLGSLVGGASTAQGAWLNRSHSIFFPTQLKETAETQQEFPLFWWNFVIIETGPGSSRSPDFATGRKICADLKQRLGTQFARVECGQGLGDFQTLLSDWARDLPRRMSRPSDTQVRQAMDSSLAKASLPTGEPTLLAILRQDPLESWQQLKSIAEKRLPIHFPRREGFFVDDRSGRLIIPVQMGFAPSDTQQTGAILAQIGVDSSHLMGPHGSTIRNETQVMRDTDQVSKIGMVALALLGLSLFLSGRRRLLYLVPPVVLATAVSALVIIGVNGSIHGLTLSFGTGIIGLALDYGFHAALDGDQRRVWRSNLFGLLTTIAGLVVLMSSTVPLLRQLMEFSCLGLIIAWSTLGLMFKYSPQSWVAEPLPLSFKRTSGGWIGISFLVVCAVFGLVKLRPNFEIQQFDYQDSKTRELQSWLFKNLGMRSPVFNIHPGQSALAKATEEKNWADSQNIATENLANYLPPLDVQRANLRTWSIESCQRLRDALSSTDRKFFEPFLKEQLCTTQNPISMAETPKASLPSYLRHLEGVGNWITLWLPNSDEQESLIRQRYPETVSLKEMVMSFPRTLEQELRWMAPLSLFLAAGILFLYYRRIRYILSALVPFFTGLGLVSLAIWIFKLDVSFISLVALILVFGFSIDYGIFATDLGRRVPGWRPEGVWSAITLAAFTMIIGFVPLLFCRHPVLAHLGQTLFFGALGTYLGAVFGIPLFMERKQ